MIYKHSVRRVDKTNLLEKNPYLIFEVINLGGSPALINK